MKNLPDGEKVKRFVIAGVVALVLGYGLDLLGITPIIKRICTSSFILASGGWALLALGLFYWLVDMKKVQSWTFPFILVGMNPIFIYLFAQILGRWLYNFIKIFSFGIMEPMGVPEPGMQLINAMLTLGALWYLCYFLYRKKIFFKI